MGIDQATRLELGDSLFAAALMATSDKEKMAFVGLCGSQGSGKSTTVARLQHRLATMGKRVVVFSLDDFYLTRAERIRLSRQVHPLLATRGVPGTHDVGLLMETLASLRTAGETSRIALPGFDKTVDDRLPRDQWPLWSGKPDIVLLEGWCVGATPQPRASLPQAVNRLERDEDADGTWRGFVNERLEGEYARLFGQLDLKLMLCAPDFSCVHGWRREQEAGLPRGEGSHPPMDDAALTRFIEHYERLTRWLIATKPADLVAHLDKDRSPFGWTTSATPPSAA